MKALIWSRSAIPDDSCDVELVVKLLVELLLESSEDFLPAEAARDAKGINHAVSCRFDVNIFGIEITGILAVADIDNGLRAAARVEFRRHGENY